MVWEWFTEEAKPVERDWSYLLTISNYFWCIFNRETQTFLYGNLYMVINSSSLSKYSNNGKQGITYNNWKEVSFRFLCLKRGWESWPEKNTPKYFKVMQRWIAKQKLRGEDGAQGEYDFLSRYFLRLKYFKKYPRNAEIRY